MFVQVSVHLELNYGYHEKYLRKRNECTSLVKGISHILQWHLQLTEANHQLTLAIFITEALNYLSILFCKVF